MRACTDRTLNYAGALLDIRAYKAAVTCLDAKHSSYNPLPKPSLASGLEIPHRFPKRILILHHKSVRSFVPRYGERNKRPPLLSPLNIHYPWSVH